MKQKILVVSVVSSLILLVGLSFQLGRSVNTHGSENSHLASQSHVDEELHTEEAMDPNMPGMDHSNTDEATDSHADEAMDPNMPGMDHSNTEVVDAEVDRPLKATLGTFGVATSIILSGALILRRRDDKVRKHKIEVMKNRGESQ
jgi:hypothetical protein